MAASSTAMAQGRNVVIVGALVIALLVPVLLSAHRHTDAWSPRHRVVDDDGHDCAPPVQRRVGAEQGCRLFIRQPFEEGGSDPDKR